MFSDKLSRERFAREVDFKILLAAISKGLFMLVSIELDQEPVHAGGDP